MAFTFTNSQRGDLRSVWRELDGLDHLADDFINELTFYMKHSPELITNSHKKIETEESKDYLKVAVQCEKLLRELENIPELDRVNILSLREKRATYGGKIVPLVDPSDYVKTIEDQAKHYSYELKKFTKCERQLNGLKLFVNRFPPARSMTKSQFIGLACILYQDENDTENKIANRFFEAVKNIGYKNLGGGK